MYDTDAPIKVKAMCLDCQATVVLWAAPNTPTPRKLKVIRCLRCTRKPER